MVFGRCGAAFKAASVTVDSGIANFFRWEGRLVARYPYVTLFLTILLATGLGVYGILFKFYEELNPSALYAAKDAPSVPDRFYVEEMYGFIPLQEKLLARSKQGLETNLLENPHESLGEYMDMWDKVHDIVYEGHTTFKDLCEQPKAGYPCKVFSILSYWDFNSTILSEDPDPLRTINQGPLEDGYGKVIDIDFVLGGIERNDQGDIVYANAFQTVFGLDLMLGPLEKSVFDSLRKSGRFQKQEKYLTKIEDLLARGFDPRPLAFDKIMAKEMENWGQGNKTELYARMTHLFLVQEESNMAIREDMWWILLASVLVGVYSHSVLFRNNWALCKLHLVGLCFFAIGLAVAASFGLALILNVPFNLIVTTVPFLLLGLGVDDTFIIMGQFRRTDRRLPPEERISLAMSRAGSSIFVTSLTDLVAFMLALSSTLPALRQFGVYASFGVLFDFFFQVTTFLAFAALEARREHRMLEGAGFLGMVPKKSPALQSPESNASGTIKSMEGPLPVTAMGRFSNNDRQTNPGSQALGPVVSLPLGVPQQPLVEHQAMCGSGPFDPNAPSFATKLFGRWIPSITFTWWGSTVALLLEVIVIGVAIYGCMNVGVDWRFREWFSPAGWLHDGFKIEEQSFHGEQMLLNVYTKQGSYFYNQKEMLNCVAAVRNNEYFSETPDARSWFEDFIGWLQESHMNETSDSGLVLKPDRFFPLVMEFLGTDGGAYFRRDVVLSPDRSQIVSTKLVEAYSVDVASGLHAVEVMGGVREVVTSAVPELQPIVFNPMFPFYDGLKIIEYETVRNVLSVGAAVFFVVALTLANVFASFLVVLMIILTDVMLFGYMWYIGLTFNMVTSITIVLAVGIAVDYAVHIAHNFLVQKGTRKQRATQALENIGGEVFCAAFTSFLAVTGLAFTKHYVMQVFFKMFSVITVLGAWHGLVILPIILAYIGPKPYAESRPH